MAKKKGMLEKAGEAVTDAASGAKKAVVSAAKTTAKVVDQKVVTPVGKATGLIDAKKTPAAKKAPAKTTAAKSGKK